VGYEQILLLVLTILLSVAAVFFSVAMDSIKLAVFARLRVY